MKVEATGGFTAEHRPPLPTGGTLPAGRLVSGHYWTVYGYLRASARPRPRARPWSAWVQDAALGAIRLSGAFSEVPGARRAVILIHGMGGSAKSPYLVGLQSSALSRGVSTLCINLRGADGHGPDLYHAGLWQDVAAALRSPELADYPEVFLVGYSLGGHVALRCALHCEDERLRRVVAVCPPLQLAASSRAFARCSRAYNWHVLRGLVAMYRPVAEPWRQLGGWDVPTREQAAEIKTLQHWDERIIAPRHGFSTAAEYYESESVAPHLGRLTRPTLVAVAEADPMVPLYTLEPWLSRVSPAVRVWRLPVGGHLGFPRRLPGAGFAAGAADFESQVLGFLGV